MTYRYFRLLASVALITLLGAAGVALFYATRGSAQISCPTPNFAVLGASTVTNTGPTVITGDLGLSPGSSITGFFGTTANDGPGVVIGTIHQTNMVAATAQTNARTTYNTLAGLPCTHTLTGTDLGGLTLTPGVYCFASSAQLTGTLTLSGMGQFVFKIGSTLTTASGSSVVLINGASSCNVNWQVGTSATLGTTTQFVGNIYADQSVTLNTGATVNGSVTALIAAVTLDSNRVTACCLVPAPTPTPTPPPHPTPTPTPTPIPTPTPTPTPIPTPTPTPPPHPTPTPIPTPTPTPTPTTCDCPPDVRATAEIRQHPLTYRVTFTNSSTTCAYLVGAATYQAFANQINNQRLFDSRTGTVPINGTLILEVPLPSCAYQADAFCGPVIGSFCSGILYGPRLLTTTGIVLNTGFCQNPVICPHNSTLSSGRATAVNATIAGINATLVDTGPLPAAGGSIARSLLSANVRGGAFTTWLLNATTLGFGDQSRSQAIVENLNFASASSDITCGTTR